MIEKIIFKNYKSFKEQQTLVLKPITVLIGKNSSGKSAVAKLPTMIEGSLSGKITEPVSIINDEIELGAEFRDLIYGREIGSLELSLKEGNKQLHLEVVAGLKEADVPKIRKWSFNDKVELSYKYASQNYIDLKNNKIVDVDFNGFNITTGIEHEFKGQLFNLKTNYIGPFREIPDRNHTFRGSLKSNKIGIKGEHTYQILISDHLHNDGTLLKKVSKWYQNNFDGWGVAINAQSKPDYKIELTRKDPDFSINIRDVGEGMSQVLPSVVSAFNENNNEMLTILEQPELHLHPGAHGNLAELFANSTKKGNKFLIETHSQNFVLRLRRMVAEKRFCKDDIALYSVEYNSNTNTSNLIKIDINADGSVAYWPEKVFSETLDETLAIRNAQLKNK
ncbi:AAA family ATPase [Plebeiibacterium sediminum]|uniref:AAA family ATPase n=1 Tax=Plebeiibacterium sediminum TaxID=2992112 RepID=A0AAE3SFU8_9BACT|nr:AAA family ATPase [Plebeiobacterium sediminum]MCW3787651.1 AAA family ATPase [Plebeiobacterium sediminum]